jgi:hypothetical protein
VGNMDRPKIKVGSYYEFTVRKDYKIAFGVLYGFERGRNKDVYTIRMYTSGRDFEFPLTKSQFKEWVNEGRIKEISSDEALTYII